MTSKESDTGVVDPLREIVESESELKEEVHRLKHQMVEMYQAWIRGHPPPSFPANYTKNPAFIPPLTQAQNPTTVDLSPQHAPGFTPFHHYPGTSSQTFHAPPAKTTVYPAPTSAPIYVAPPRAILHRSSIEPVFQAPDTQYYAPEPTFQLTDPYSYTPHFEPPIETEKPSRNVEQDEIFRKVKSLEQSLKNMKGIGCQVSVAYKDLCLLPDVQLPAGFKMPKFDLYDGHGDPVAHLRGFCTKMRGAGGKDELLMAYFSQSKSFNDVVNMGGMVEERLKSSKIMRYSSIKATTHAIQSGTGSLLGKKKKDDVAMFVSRSGRGPRGSPHQYTQPRPQPQAYTQAPYNPFQHYFPQQDPQYSVRPPQYHVHHAQSYVQPPPYPQWRAPTPQNRYPPPQPYRNPTGPSFRSRPDYRKERQQRKKTFTPLGESYTSLFQRLRQLDVLRPIEPKTPNPPSRNLDYSLRCAYCSDSPGHDTEKCWHLKRAIQELIDTNQIVVQSLEVPNINQNPLPAHAETHMIEIVHKDGEPKNSSKSIMMIRASESNPVKAPDLAKAMPLIVEGVSENLSTLNVKPFVLVVKGPPIDVEANQEKQKVIVPGVPGKPVIIVEGDQELRKAKPFKDGHIPVKKLVTEEEAEEFLKKIKMQDYSIVEQLRKTPTQISLLSLLIHSDEHRKALMKILNEAHIPNKITVNHLEKIANKIFEANRITFSDDELPMEGTENN
ncbi:uncharacterized protein [Nicotiana tomentosiformis]|uniref:uncharacterized protein n=1 Tax=Nicotiana tomentosiformis TaxID=4098 RepID=UPI00388CAC17